MVTLSYLLTRFSLVGLAVCLLLSCSGGGGSGTGGGGTTPASTSSNTLVDSPVANLPYTTSTNPGTRLFTGSAGEFQCLPGAETVTFYYGSTNTFIIPNPMLCPATPSVVTTVSLLGASSVTDPSVNNLAQLLMTLDTKTNPNAITIPNPLPAGYVPANVPPFTTANTTTFNTSLTTAFAAGTTITTPAQAAAQLATSFKTLTVTIVNNGSVTSNPAGITCPGTCSFVFQTGTAVTLTAGPGLTGWSIGGCSGTACTLKLTNDTTVTASFAENGTTPTLVQHYASPFESLFPGGFYTFHPPNVTLTGNLLIVGIQKSGFSTGVTIGDNKGGSWTAGPSVQTADNQIVQAFYQANNPGGITTITISPSETSEDFSFVFTEVANIATTSPLEASTANQTSAPSVNAGTMTTTVDGDYVWTFGCDTTVADGVLISGISPGTGATLLSADRNSGIVVQQQIQASAGSITPAFVINGITDTVGTVSMAFKAASAGTTPSVSPRILKLVTQSIAPSQGSSFTMQFPSSGTTLIMTYNSEVSGSEQSTTISTLTDSANNTWARAVGPVQCPTCGPANTEIWYAKNAMTSLTLSITLTPANPYTGSIYHATLDLYDVVGLDPTNPLDVTAGASGIQTAIGNLTTITLIPTTANGLVITSTIIDAHTVNGLSSPAGTFDCLVNSTADGNDTTLCEANGMAHFYNPTTVSETWLWTTLNNPDGVNGWASVGAAFKRAP